MELNEIKQHWENWAKEFKLDIRATTKTGTIKKLEVNALYHAFMETPFSKQPNVEVLEVGCGNGHNCFSLSELMPNFIFTGVDLVSEMVSNAIKIKEKNKEYKRVKFFQGNILDLVNNPSLKDKYDIVFTDRCLINLNKHNLHEKGLDQLYSKTKKQGYIVLIENIFQTYSIQNELRESVGLKKRTPDKFNLFVDEPSFLAHARTKLNLERYEDFGSLHDIILYILVPMINDGEIDYDNPLVTAATELLLSNSDKLRGSFGSFGQNRLYVFRKDHFNEE